MKKIVLKTERLVVRNVRIEDEAFLLSLYRNPKVNATYVCDSLQKEEVLHHFVSKLVNKEDDGESYFWIVEYNQSPVGCFNTFTSKDDSSTIEIGYCIDPSYWGQGFATEVLKATITYLQQHTAFHKIQCGYFLFNLTSKRVMEKAGMTFEGIRKDVFYFRNAYQSIGYYYCIGGTKDE